MAVNGIGLNYYQNHQPTTNQYTDHGGKDFGAKIGQIASGSMNKITIDPDALFSICDARTGESANVYRVEGYSDANPLYLVKGIDRNGKEYEDIIDVSKVNPNHCSYKELLALNAHSGKKSDSDFLTMAVLKDKAKTASYEDKADYLFIAYGILQEMKTAGYWDSYMRYDKWIDKILSVSTGKMTTWYQGAPLQNKMETDSRHTDQKTGIS